MWSVLHKEDFEKKLEYQSLFTLAATLSVVQPLARSVIYTNRMINDVNQTGFDAPQLHIASTQVHKMINNK